MNNIKYAFALLLAGSLGVAAQGVSAPKPCAKTYDINDIVSKLNNNFPGQLKDCSANVTKDMAQAATAAKLKRKVEKKDYKAFMKQCATDGVKKELPDGFPGTNKVIGGVDNFLQNILNSASAANGELDPKKLASALGGMSIDGFLSDVKKSLGPDECVGESIALAPVAPPMDVEASESNDTSNALRFKIKDNAAAPAQNIVGYLGIRAGINSSHLSATAQIVDINGVQKKAIGTYDDVLGFQVGMVVDIAPTNLFHIQPGFMYIQKGTKNNGVSATAHYIEIPLLLSLKFSMLDINVGPSLGPYFDIYLGSGKDEVFAEDIGLNFGLGIDIGMFYIGAFYDYGLTNTSYNRNFKLYNRTLGTNLGVNL